MKRMLFPILVLVLALGLALPMAGTVEAVTPPLDRTAAITAAADRLAEQQNTGDGYDEGYIGGWRMLISETPPGTYLRTHNIGVTAIGILKAYELQDEVAYETALAKAYKFVVDHEPGWIQDPNDASRWKESPGGVNSWPDIHFLIGLADAAALDSSLLTAIQGEVPGTTADDIAALAKARWDDRLNHAGAVYPSEVGTATGMADWLVYVRVPNWASLIPWDLEPAVKSALALHEKYPEDGYLAQAQDIAEAIYDCIYGDPSYLDINDPEEKCYTLGLAGAIEAFTEAGLYPDEASQLKDLLIAYQNEVGFWDANDRTDEDAGTQCVQETAYAVMALIAQGDADARTAAMKGSSWLVNTQDVLGGWDPSSFESGDENLECDGEAAWALATAEAPVTIGDDGYYSIQSAIDAASSGDTINVAAGTYDETVTLKSTTASDICLVGENRATTFITGGICFASDYTGLEVRSFTITGNGYLNTETYEATISCKWPTHYAVTNLEFSDCVFDGEGYVDEEERGRCGVLIKRLGGVVKFENNEFKDYRGWATLDVNDGSGGGHLAVTSYTFNNNNVHDNWGSCVLRGNPADRTDTVTVSGNTFNNNGNPAADSWAALEINEADSVTVCDNTIANTQAGSWGEGQALQLWKLETVNIYENVIENNFQGIAILNWPPGENYDVSGISIYNNSFSDNDEYALFVEDGLTNGPVDAENNWWGHASGPSGEYGRTNPAGKVIGKGDAVSDNVDWDPWLSHPFDLTPHVPAPPGPP